jgi:hypothetical protein
MGLNLDPNWTNLHKKIAKKFVIGDFPSSGARGSFKQIKNSEP